MRTIAVTVVALAALAATMPLSLPLHAERIGKVSQPIIVGDEVGVERQRQLGLVTVGGRCSGTLINRYWVLTASHCVSMNGTEGGPDAPFSERRIAAAWTSKSATPTRYVRYWRSNNLDVALIFLGFGDLGPVDRRLIYPNAVEPYIDADKPGTTLMKFGIGYCAFASGAGADATPAESDCGYRSARLSPSEANDLQITYAPNAAGQISSFGDSGGPDFVTDADGNPFAIAGVTVSGSAEYLEGKPEKQKWVSDSSESFSAALYTIRDDIHRHMNEGPSVGVTTRPKDYGDVIVSRDKGVLTRGPSSYKDAMIDPNAPPVVASPPALPYGPATCLTGYVWRVAAPADLVCVTPDARDRVAEENATARERWRRRGEDGNRICRRGYVYREAYADDDVCVTPESYDLVAEENALGPSRRVQQ